MCASSSVRILGHRAPLRHPSQSWTAAIPIRFEQGGSRARTHDDHATKGRGMNHLINIDNGGTLTDICVWNGQEFSFTKTLTTPFDLSQCLFDGIAKASATLYGDKDLVRLLHRPSTSGTPRRRAPTPWSSGRDRRIGLLVDRPDAGRRAGGHGSRKALDELVGARVARHRRLRCRRGARVRTRSRRSTSCPPRRRAESWWSRRVC